MPGGALVTVPVPVPSRAIVRRRSPLSISSKRATQMRSALTSTSAEAAVPEHAPDHDENRQPGSATAVSVTLRGSGATSNVSSQSVGQAMPAGSLVTLPLPATSTTSAALRPANFTLQYSCPSTISVVVEEASAQSQCQPSNSPAIVGVAASSTIAPSGTLAQQNRSRGGHSRSTEGLVTVPSPPVR